MTPTPRASRRPSPKVPSRPSPKAPSLPSPEVRLRPSPENPSRASPKVPLQPSPEILSRPSWWASARGALRAEWTKLRTVRGTGWLLVAFVVGTVALSTMVVLTLNNRNCPVPGACDEDLPLLTLAGVYIGQIGVVVLAGLAVTAEYATGTMDVTVAATPRRPLALAAKATVVTATILVGGVLAVLGAFAVGRLILPGHGFAALSLADPATLRAHGGTVLYFGLVGLLSLGTGYAVRDTAGTLTTVLGLLYVPVIVAGLVNNEHWREWILRLSPMAAGLTIQVTKRLDALPQSPWQGLGVLTAYATAAMLTGGLLFRLRDS